MKQRLCQIALGVCQAIIVICVVVDANDAGTAAVGILIAAIFTSTINILLDLPGGFIRWSVAALYVAAFGTAYHFGWRHDDTFWLRSFAGAILVGFYGCVVAAVGVVIVRWVARVVVRIPWNVLWNILRRDSGDEKIDKPKTSDRVTKLKPNEVKAAGDKLREPIFGPAAPGALVYVVGQVLVAFLYAWFSSSH